MDLKRLLPNFVRVFISMSGLSKIRFLVKNKYRSELDFWVNWSKDSNVSSNIEKVHTLWKKHRFLDEIIEMCGLTEKSKALDVGCGLSSVLHFVEGERFAVDPLADEYVKLYNFGKIKVRKAYGEYLPFTDLFFDVVFCSNALDHTSDPKKVISEIFRVLKYNGLAVVVVDVFDEHFRRDPGHPHVFRIQDVIKLTKNFHIVFKKVSTWNIKDCYDGIDEERTDLVLVLKK